MGRNQNIDDPIVNYTKVFCTKKLLLNLIKAVISFIINSFILHLHHIGQCETKYDVITRRTREPDTHVNGQSDSQTNSGRGVKHRKELPQPSTGAT